MRKFLIYILPVFLLVFLLMNTLRSDILFDNSEDSIEYYKELKNEPLLIKTYYDLTTQDVSNYKNHYKFLYYYFRLRSQDSTKVPFSLERITIKYNGFLNSNDVELQNIGSWGFSFIYYYLNQPEKSFDFLLNVTPNSPYVNYLLGNYYFYYDWQKSNNYYNQEINLFPSNEVAYEKKSNLLLFYDQLDSLELLINSSPPNYEVGNSIKRQVFLKKGYWMDYIKEVFNRFLYTLNWTGLFGAFIILLVWLVYLLKLYQNKIKFDVRIYIVLFLGMLFAFGTSILSDINKYKFFFDLNGELLNDFIYCIVGIGMVEELVKIIPLLLVMKFYSKKLQPIDILVFASVSALGFAFIENIIYFDLGGIRTIQGRALTATVVHMFNSSIIAYGLIISKYGKKKNTLLQFLLYFFIAAFTHGFYDFWLINTQAVQFNFITFIWLLMCMILWVSMINNCINNSFSLKNNWKYQPKKTNTFLLFGLSLVFLIEYILVGIEYGAQVANLELQKDISSGLFLLLFLTLSLSKFDYIPNYWAPLRFWDWDLMLSIPKTKHNYFEYKNIIGYRVKLKPYGHTPLLIENTNIEGTIIKRELLSWEKDWYLIKLDCEIKYGWNTYRFILVKSKYYNKPFFNDKEEVVKLRLVKNIDDLSNRIKRKRSFLLVDYVILERLSESE